MKKHILIFTAVFCILTYLKTSHSGSQDQNNVTFENQTTAMVVGANGLISKTEDGGLMWVVLNSGVTNNLNGCDYVEYTENEITEKLYIAVGDEGIVLKSSDNGGTWISKTTGTSENLNDIRIFAHNMMYVCGNNGVLMFSADLGETWETVSTGTTENLNDILVIGVVTPDILSYYNELTTLIVGGNGTILKQTGVLGGWNMISSGTTEQLNSMYNLNSETIYAAGNTGTLLKSVDRGASWSALSTGITENIHEITFLNDNTTGIASCSQGVIVRTIDAGDTWEAVNSTVSVDLYSVDFGSPLFGIATGENSTEIYTLDGGLTWENREAERIAGNNNTIDGALLRNYPNPFNPSTSISYSLPFDSHLMIRVYDMTGREVATLVNEYKTAGNYSVQFNANKLASGIYFYSMIAENGSSKIVKTMRMILTK